MKKVACIYHFFENDIEQLENLKYFLAKGISPDIEYFFLLASRPEIEFPTLANLKLFDIPNKSYDVGGYQAGFKIISEQGDWDYVFFLNSGVLGPILPGYTTTPWYELFISKLNSETKIVGTTVNLLPNVGNSYPTLKAVIDQSDFRDVIDQNFSAHIQTMFFCISGDALDYVASKGLFDQVFSQEKLSIIANFELLLSQLLLRNGWNLSCIQKEYDNFDFRNITVDPNFSARNGDPYYPQAYFGRSVNPWDVIFFKTTRGLLHPAQLKYLRSI